MPFVTITVRKPKTLEFKSNVLQAIHQALIGIGAPPTDRFHRVLELSEEDFQFDLCYPDVQGCRDNDFILIEILWAVGRSVKIKKSFLNDLMSKLQLVEVNPENVMVIFKETGWENWSFAGGRQIHV